MGLYRDETGRVIEVDDRFAEARGYTPLTSIEHEDINAQRGLEARGAERGALGSVNAALTGVESALTLGGSDYLLGKVLPDAERERLNAEIEAHPYLRMGGEIAGTFAGALAPALGRTPTGYLSNLAQHEVEAGLAAGGVAGGAKALTAMGAEGAAQSVGQYIGHASLEDKEVTAEGLTGALGVGFAFGAGGGGAALGVSNGLVAGRRLFSRVMAGKKAAEAAESAWSLASQEALAADQATARALETKLENIRKAKMEALRSRNEARAAAQEASVEARGQRAPKEAPDFEASIPTDVIPKGKPEPKQGGMPTSVFRRPGEFEGPQSLIDVGEQPQGAATSVFVPKKSAMTEAATDLEKATKAVPETWREFVKGKMGEYMKSEGGHAGAMKRLGAEWKARGAAPSGRVDTPFVSVEVTRDGRAGATSLEEQLAGTKAQLDQGKALKDVHYGEDAVPGAAVSPQIPPGKTPPEQPGRAMGSNSINDWLSEKAAFDNAELSQAKKLEDLKGLRELRNRRQETLSEIRYKATEDLLGSAAAKEEQRIADIVEEYNAARADLESIPVRDTEGFPPTKEGRPDLQGDNTLAGKARNRQAIEILDDAHEEALLRAKHAADPQEAGRAITEAEELERMLEKISTPRLHTPDQPLSAGELRSPNSKAWTDELQDHIAKIERYERASAALAEEAGDAAHPVSAERTKNLRAADRDGTRRVYDRTTRATDDAADGTSAAAKAKAARKEQIKAQAKLDELKVQHEEARHELQGANRKVRAGEKAKREALRTDAKLARAGVKAGGVDAGDAGGLLEMADIPGMPKPSDLPVVGPLLGAYLKFRTLKKALGRAMGRVPATADARVAVLASQTRDRIARAVDRSIGVMERGVQTVTKAAPPIAGILSQRIFDDGGENPKTDDVQELAAARMREVAAYVHTPGAIERDVRRELVDVTDPDLIAAAEAQRRAIFEYLLSVSPKLPELSPLNQVKYRPGGAQAMAFGRTYEALIDPATVFERLAQEQTMLSLEAAQALRKVYPRLFGEASARLLDRAAEGNLKVPMRTRVQLSLLYQVPLDTSMDPVNLKITQSVYDRKVQTPAPGGPAPAVPSIANPVNISQQLNPTPTRR